MKNVFKNKVISTVSSIGFLSVIALSVIFIPNKTKADNALPIITVYKSPTCGCCSKWVKHLENNGFVVEAKNSNKLDSIKRELGIEPQFQSCHTAKIGNYVVEGHVPASDIKRMLVDKPDIHGLAVPGMPMGSPGMEGSRKDKYNVLAIKNGASPTIFSSH